MDIVVVMIVEVVHGEDGGGSGGGDGDGGFHGWVEEQVVDKQA